MLFSVIVTLLIASNGIPSIQAEEKGGSKAQLNGTFVNGGDSIIEVLTTQENNTFNTGPNDNSKYGSIVEVKTDIYNSPNSRQPDSTQTRTYTAAGGPGHDGVSYVRSEERNHQGQPNQNQTFDNKVKLIVKAETHMNGNSFNSDPGSDNFYGSRIQVNYHIIKSEGNNNLTQPNEKQIPSYGGHIQLNAKANLTNNHILTDPGMKVSVGNSIKYHVYLNLDTDKQAQDNKKKEKHDEEHTELTDPGLKVSVGNSIKYHVNLNLHTDKQAQDNKKKEKHDEEHTESNGQTSLPSNAFYSFLGFLVILLNHSLF